MDSNNFPLGEDDCFDKPLIMLDAQFSSTAMPWSCHRISFESDNMWKSWLEIDGRDVIQLAEDATVMKILKKTDINPLGERQPGKTFYVLTGLSARQLAADGQVVKSIEQKMEAGRVEIEKKKGPEPRRVMLWELIQDFSILEVIFLYGTLLSTTVELVKKPLFKGTPQDLRNTMRKQYEYLRAFPPRGLTPDEERLSLSDLPELWRNEKDPMFSLKDCINFFTSKGINPLEAKGYFEAALDFGQIEPAKSSDPSLYKLVERHLALRQDNDPDSPEGLEKLEKWRRHWNNHTSRSDTRLFDKIRGREPVFFLLWQRFILEKPLIGVQLVRNATTEEITKVLLKEWSEIYKAWEDSTKVA